MSNTYLRNKTFDDIAGTSIVLSFKKLKSSYNGYCLKLRRSSDNAEQDFGFDTNDNIDTSSISSWLSTDTAYVVKWYDQSGWSNDAYQTTNTNQPVFDVSNKKITFTSANVHYLTVNNHESINHDTSDFTYFTEAEFDSISGNHNILFKGSFSSPRNYTRIITSETSLIFATEDTAAPEEAVSTSSVNTSTPYKLSCMKNSDAIEIYEGTTFKNNTNLSGIYGSLTNTSDLYIGTNNIIAERLDGSLKSIFSFKKALSSNELQIVNSV